MNSSVLGAVVVAAVGSLVSLVLMLLHPIGPALFISIVTPFDALFAGLFGVAGNAVTYLPFIVLALRVPIGLFPTFFLGTAIQITMALFILSLSISHIMVIDSLGQAALVEYARKITIFLLVGLISWGMRSSEYLTKMNKTLVVSMAIFVVLSLLDFYLGIRILPGAADTYGGVFGLSLDDVGVHSLRFNGGGLTINQTANWMLVPIFLSLGWFLMPDRKGRTLALVCLAICVAGLGATISRSGLLGLVAGAVVLAPTAARLGLSQMILTAIAAVIALAVGFLLLEQSGFTEAFLSRFLPEASGGQANETGRLLVFGTAFRLFTTSPIIGIGDSMTAFHPQGIGLGAHNSILGLLSETGIVGTVPYLLLIFLVFRRLIRRVGDGVASDYAHWRPFFLASYIACMVQSSFNEYTWERLTWYVVAFSAALELQERIGNSAPAAAEARNEPDTSTGGDGIPTFGDGPLGVGGSGLD